MHVARKARVVLNTTVCAHVFSSKVSFLLDTGAAVFYLVRHGSLPLPENEPSWLATFEVDGALLQI